jgi:hypothetical protein
MATGNKLIAGALTAAALLAFADNRALAQNAPDKKNAPVTTQPGAKENAPAQVFTKDGKPLNVTIDIPVINPGKYKPDVFKQMMSDNAKIQAMMAVSQFTQEELLKPENMKKVQDKIAEGISTMVLMEVTKEGKPVFAQKGVHFGPPAITKVAEMQSGKVLFEKKAPATQPATKPAVKA